MAKLDPIPIERHLHALDEELLAGTTPAWRKQQIEQLQPRLRVTHRAATEARRRVLVRRLFAGMHAVTGDERKIADALSQLAEQGLVWRGSETHGGIDCHPLVRDYFGARLKELDSEIFRAAHGRLYDYYRYAGLPAAFREPVAYALLALAAAFRNVHTMKIVRVAKQKQWPGSWKEAVSRFCWRRTPGQGRFRGGANRRGGVGRGFEALPAG